MVEVTGELLAKGRKPDGSPWRIALEQPLAGSQQVIQRNTRNRRATVLTRPVIIVIILKKNGVRFSHTI